MTSNKYNLILEIVWIIMGLLCIAAGTRLFIIKGYETRVLLIALMAVISFLFAWFRHTRRKKS